MKDKNQNQTCSNLKKRQWVPSAAVISSLSVIFSLIAIAVSIRSCCISGKALNLTTQDFLAARSAIYKGVLNEQNDELFLSAIDPSIQMQCAEIHLPSQLDRTTWNISPPSFGFPLVMMKYQIEEFLGKNVAKEKGYIKVVDQTSIPLIIGSTYIAKGQSYSDMSLYLLVYIAVVSDETYDRPKVTFKGLIFSERLPMSTNPQKYLDALWEGALREKSGLTTSADAKSCTAQSNR